MEQYKNYDVAVEMVTVRARSQEEAEKLAQKFYKNADLSYFQAGNSSHNSEALIGLGCHYDIRPDEKIK